MTVQSSISKIIYSGNGATTVFSTVFSFINNEDVKVVLTSSSNIETSLSITTHYTLSGGGGSIGNVTMITAPASGEKLTIYREPPITQLTDYVNGDSFDAESHERALDKITHVLQSIDEKASRSIKLPVSTSFGSEIVPTANRVIGFNSTATAIEYYLPNADFTEINSVTTAAQLRTTSPTSDGQVIALVGNTTAGIDGGLFRYDASDTTTTDNNVSVIVTSDNKRWKKLIDSNENVEVINYLWQGDFQVWQRGVSFNSFPSRQGVADGWSFARSSFASGATVSQATGENEIYSIKVQRDAGNTATNTLNLNANLSYKDSIKLSGKNVSFGFRAKKGADFSASSITASLRYTTYSSEQSINLASGQYSTNDIFLTSLSANLNNSWSDFFKSVLIPDTAKQIQLRFQYVPTGTAGVDDYFCIEEVFLIEGVEKKKIKKRTFEDVIFRALTEYRKSYNYDTQEGSVENAGAIKFSSYGTSTNLDSLYSVAWENPMRTPPTISVFNPSTGNSGSVRNVTDSTNITVNASNIGTNGFCIEPSTFNNHYLEGVFTPAFSGVTVTHTTQTGRFSQIGNMVFFEGVISYNTLDTTDTSDIQISLTGLPSALNNGLGGINICLQSSTGLSFSASDVFIPNLYTSSLTIALTDGARSNWHYNDSKLSTSGNIVFTGYYRVNKSSALKTYALHYFAESRL